MDAQREEQFNNIVAQLAKNNKDYDDKKIKHYQWAEQTENIFASFGWHKKEFYKELNVRLGIQTPEPKVKPTPKKKRKAKVIDKK